MPKSLEDIAKDLEGLKGESKETIPSKAKLESLKDLKKPKGKNHGGKRENSGRKPLPIDEARRSLKKSWENFALGEVEMNRLDKGTQEIRKVKVQRIAVAQEMLFDKVKEKDVAAIKEFNDRSLGKSKQPITGGDEDDTPLRLEVDITKIGSKIYGLEDTDEE